MKFIVVDSVGLIDSMDISGTAEGAFGALKGFALTSGAAPNKGCAEPNSEEPLDVEPICNCKYKPGSCRMIASQ